MSFTRFACVEHGPGDACACAARGGPTQQNLAELDFMRSACAHAQYGRVDKLRATLQRNPDAVHDDGVGGSSGYTPLHYAARANQLEAAQLLVDKGAQVNACTREGRATPLHRAAMQGHTDMCRLLLRHGAQAKVQDADGETPLHKACAQGRREAALCLLQHAPEASALVDKKGRTPRDVCRGGQLAEELDELLGQLLPAAPAGG